MGKDAGIHRRLSFSFIAVFFLLLAVYGHAFHPWTAERARAGEGESWQTQNHFHRFTTDVCAIDRDNAWVVGDGGSILRTRDGGRTWVEQKAGFHEDLKAVSACDPLNAWAVGGDGEGSVVLHTSDGGASWAIQPLPQACVLHDVFAVDALHAWAVGDDGALVFTSDGGTSWHACAGITSRDLYAVWAADSLSAWAVGEAGTILGTHDGGNTWNILPSGTSYTLLGIDGLGGSTLWAVGSQGTALRSGDGGSVWENLPSSVSYTLDEVTLADEETAWVAGNDEASLRGKILKAADGSWSLQQNMQYNARGVSAADYRNAWAVGGDIDILHTSDGGGTWEDQYPATTSTLTGISVVDRNTAWVARGAGDVLVTSDGGETWASRNTGPDEWEGSIYDVAAVDGLTAWAVGREGTLLRTDDGGLSWARQDAGTGASLYAATAVDAVTAWAAGASGTIIKTEDGLAWEPQASGTGAVLTDICSAGPDVAWALGTDPETHGSVLLRTVDGGETWLLLTHPYDFYDLCAAGANTLWAVGPHAVARSADGGDSWEILPGFPSSRAYPSKVFALDGRTAWVSATDADVHMDAIYRTNDGGESWKKQASYLPHVEELAAADHCHAWAVGRSGLILHTSDGGDGRPDIAAAQPVSGTVGSEVTIFGCDFGAVREGSKVSFDATPAEEYISWAPDRIVVRVPALDPGVKRLRVETPAGASNDAAFTVTPLAVLSVSPPQVMQHTLFLTLEVTGSGFQPGATVRLKRGTSELTAYNVQVISETRITCTCGFFGVEPSIYDVEVMNPGGESAVLAGGFTVVSPCGTGSGAAAMSLCLGLGLLSTLASLRRRRAR